MPRLMSWIEPGCGATGGMRKSIEATKMPLSARAFAMKSLSVRSLLVQAPPCTWSGPGCRVHLLSCGRYCIQFAVSLLNPSGAEMALHCDADMVRTIVGASHVKLLSGPAGSQGQDALTQARCAGFASRPGDLLAAALGGRPRARRAVEAFAPAAAVDVGFLASGVLPTRVSTRLAVSRSVCAFGLEPGKPFADLRPLSADLVQYRGWCAWHGGLQ